MDRQETECISIDGLKLKGSFWAANIESTANILIIHGLGEHHRRYDYVAKLFAEKGLNVYAYGRIEG